MPLKAAEVSTDRIFRVLLFASIAVPLFLFAGAGWLTYGSAFEETERDLVRTTAVVQEHALKVLETHQLLADRVGAVLLERDGWNPDSERAVHDSLNETIRGMPQVRTIWVVDRNGRAVASTSTYPVPRSVDFSDRDYFTALRDLRTETYISEVLKGRVDQTLFFTVAKRLERTGPFDGVVSISADPDYFADFYEKLAKNDDYLLTLARDDGAILARYPRLPFPFPTLNPSNAIMSAIRDGARSGIVRGTSRNDGIERLIAFRKVEGYPIYVIAARKTSAIVADWRTAMSGHLAFGIPASLCLFALTRVAAWRTRRERRALALLEEEMLRRQDAEKALYQAQKMESIGRITSGVAHDFNNVLQGVGGCLSALHARNIDPAADRLFETAQRGIERGARLTQHLLAFARRQTLAPKPTDIGVLLDGMRPLLERSMGGLIRVGIQVPEGTWPALVDPTQLEVAILNLAINARDAMPVGGSLSVRVVNATVPAGTQSADRPSLAPGDYVEIRVADTGTGMDEATLARAVEPFFTTKEAGKGSGLGLSMVYGMAVQSGGAMHIDSRPGAGTAVSIHLPRAEQPAAAEAPAAGTNVPGDGSTVLLVDDDALVRIGAVAILEEQGYRVVEADSAAAALDVLRDGGAVDAMVTDYAMPGMTGAALAHEARRLVPDLPILLVTGYADLPEGVERVSVLQKPFRPTDLTGRIASMVAGKRRMAPSPLRH